MKRFLALMLAAVMALALVACGGSGDHTGDTDTSGVGSGNAASSGAPSSDASSGDDANTTGGSETTSPDVQEATVPNNGEWDEILCSGDGYHLVKKEVDAYDGYKLMLGVVDDDGEWVQELTDTGAFVDAVRFRAEGSSETLRDSSCYFYLGEGVFLASPGVSVFTRDEEYRVGSWENTMVQKSPNRSELSIWECIFWNVIDNSQRRVDANKISTFQDGYLLFCEEKDVLGGGKLYAMNPQGEVTELPCVFLPNKPGHNFPVYAEGVFFACSEEGSDPGFYDMEGNRVIDLHEYNMARIVYSSTFGINAPCFENGQATILFRNNADSVFQATIDKTGAFIGEPEKVNVLVY